MSEAFDFSAADSSFLDDTAPGIFDGAPSLFADAPDLSGLFTPSSVAPIGDLFGSVAPPQSLPLSGAGGFSGMIGDLTHLVSSIYQGDVQLTAARSASELARARASNQLQTVRTTPNIWLVLGIGAAGIFALQVMDRK